MTRDEAARLDAEDTLAHKRAEFSIPDDIIYLDGNSLGALPTRVMERLDRVVTEEWGTDLIRSWNTAGWVNLPTAVGAKIGRLIGAEPGTVVAGDSTSVNLYKVVSAAAALRPDRPCIVTDTGNFPTDIYVMRGIAAARGLELRIVDPDQVGSAIGGDTAVLALTQVDYRTGRRHDMAALTEHAHRAGAIAVWDLAHTAGAIAVDLAGCEVDFAVGCGYKYLNGGPGAPAFQYVAPRHQAWFRNPITGWFGHIRPFDFDLDFIPAEGIERAAVGTPHVLSMSALDEALSVFDGIDLSEVEAKAASLTRMFIDLADRRLAEHDFVVATPRDAPMRGSHVSLRHSNAYPIVQALIAAGVVGDFRQPDVARFGFAPLYLRHVDVWDAVDRLVEVMESGAWRDPARAVRNAVT
jgi:kynureninase